MKRKENMSKIEADNRKERILGGLKGLQRTCNTAKEYVKEKEMKE